MVFPYSWLIFPYMPGSIMITNWSSTKTWFLTMLLWEKYCKSYDAAALEQLQSDGMVPVIVNPEGRQELM